MKRAVFEQVYKEQNAIKTHSLILLYMKAECCKVGKSKRQRVESNTQVDVKTDIKTDTELNANVNTQADIQIDVEFETDIDASDVVGNGIDVGFVITKKISKLAVKRNKIKRQLRALFRENIDKLPQNLLYVFLVRKVKSDNINSNSKNKKDDIENIKISNSNNKSKNGKNVSEFNSIPNYKILKRDFDYIVRKIGATVK